MESLRLVGDGEIASPRYVLTDDDKARLRRMLEAELHDGERLHADDFADYCHLVERSALDPFARQVFPVRRWDKGLGRTRLEAAISIDGGRLVAQRTGEYEGQAGPFWCGSDGVWHDVWLASEPPCAAKVGVWRRGFREPAWGVALYREYKTNSEMWRVKMPAHMNAKAAEMLGLRKAFPCELSGLYSPEELKLDITPDREVAAPAPAVSQQPVAPPPDPSEAVKELKQRLFRANDAAIDELLGGAGVPDGEEANMLRRGLRFALMTLAVERAAPVVGVEVACVPPADLGPTEQLDPRAVALARQVDRSYDGRVVNLRDTPVADLAQLAAAVAP